MQSAAGVSTLLDSMPENRKLFWRYLFLMMLNEAFASQHVMEAHDWPPEERPTLAVRDHLTESKELHLAKERLLNTGRMMADGHVNIPSNRPCPCRNQSWCDIVCTVPKHEIFIFSVHNTNWPRYDWRHITTLVMYSYFDDDAMCFAHSKGIRVVHGGETAGSVQKVHKVDFPKKYLTNETARHLWVTSTIKTMTYNFLGGVNVDFEEGISDKEAPERHGLTLLVKELNEAAKRVSPYTQITFDFACTPDVGYRRYDYKGIVDVIDFAFVMDYEEEGGKYAHANSLFDRNKHGMGRFIELGIPTNKLILGGPWYGYWYHCGEYNPTSHQCLTKAFGQINYSQIIKVKDQYSFTGRLWDPVTKSPFFTARDPITRGIYQIWYDDPERLTIKFKLLPSLRLRGAGNWQADALNYSDPKQVKDMWDAFPY
ncbi:hypothetical protein LSH36_143g02073 [Paralvinella palmiformis]|uniref:GH18 domain-containing protein n=1 Tax=Paralvinella palmiformis TaxID=53620 RepID=A0AAD9N9F3_9ANNE|nr:hypothetical protein LSH36_143g02073 [Paralvinella palmiformis]